MVVGPIDTKISDAVMNFQENSYTVSQRVRKLNIRRKTIICVNNVIDTHAHSIYLLVIKYKNEPLKIKKYFK